MEAVAVAIGTAFLNSSVDLLVKKLGSPEVLGFFKERKLDKGLLEKLAETLNTVNGLVADAEEKQITVPSVKNWLDNVKDAVYEAEDLLDEIDYEARRADSQNLDASQVRSLFLSLNRFHNRGQGVMVESMDNVFRRLERLKKDAHTLDLIKRGKENPTSHCLPTTSLLGCSRVYGRGDAKKAVMNLLLSDDAKARSLEVIPIVGMGGIGKTALAQLVYNDVDVQEWFDLKAWVYVSHHFDVQKLTKDILKTVGLLECDKMTDDQRHCELEKKVREKKLLLVLDDVWSDNEAQWDFLLAPLKSGAKGSKIVITTRNKSIASALPSVSPYPLGRISDDDCWLLFSEHAFSVGNSNRSSQLEQVGRKIVQRCSGLPLAARSLGRHLKTTSDVEKWKEVLKSNIREDILSVLRLSYHYLPSYLKRCFAYCAILAKGASYKKEELVRLWMAEGFSIHSEGSKEMKEAGYEYFQELVSRSILEQSSDQSSHFQMHDLAIELAKFVSGQFSLNLVDDGDSCKISSKTRHLAYASTSYEELKNTAGIDEAKNLRTFLSMSDKSIFEGIDNTEIHNLLLRFKRLRVLSLPCYALIDQLPDSIGNLKHLRYLNLSETSIQRLPDIVCTLYNLQTLILQSCLFLVELPENLVKLTNLCDLDITETNLRKMPLQIGKLTKLQRLTDFFVVEEEKPSIKELGELKCLKGELRIWNLQNVTHPQDCVEANLQDKDLKTLEFIWQGDTDNSMLERDVLERLRPPKNLEDLAIVGYGSTKLPVWVGDSSFSNIVSLELRHCKYCYSLPPLGQLESLKRLMIEAFNDVVVVGPEFYGSSNFTKDPFKSLESLTFERMPEWNKWIPCDDGRRCFHRLQVLCIRFCPRLTTALPSHLPSLVELQIEGCPQLMLSLPRPPNINEMTLRDNSGKMQLERLPSGLQSLVVDSFHSLDSLLKEWKEPGCLFPIQKLEVHGVSLKCLPLTLLQELKQLEIRNCPDIESLCQDEPSRDSTSTSSLKICECPGLEKLSLSNCSNLKAVHCSLPSLVNLEVRNCDELESFAGRCWPSKLESLGISHCKKLFAGRKQWDLQKLLSLSSFCFSGCEEVKSFPEEEMPLPSELTSLEISDLPNLKSLDYEELQQLTSLSKLKIMLCPDLQATSVSSLEICKFPHLEVLTLHDCPKLKSVHCFLPSLVSLEIAHCEELESFPGGCLSSKLKSLDIHGCKELWADRKQWNLPTLTSLSTFLFSGCKEVESFPEEDMFLPSSLTFLTVDNLPNLTSLNYNGLRHLTSLETLRINNCPKLQSMPNQSLPSSIKTLSVISCPLLEQRWQREDWPMISHISEIWIAFEKINSAKSLDNSPI